MDQSEAHEAIIQKHKQEKKILQAQIQSLKKTVTKGDKKKKKEVHDEITKLEEALTAKHNDELKELEESLPHKAIDTLSEAINEVTVDDHENQPKKSKAQKRRQKKDQSNKERDLRIAQEEEENKDCLRNTETNKISEKLRDKNLMIFEIPSDGDCLFKAVDHGLRSGGVPLGVDLMRQRVSQYIMKNPNEYRPFLTDHNTGELLDEEKFRDYCDKVANSKQWGGQVELDALANIVQKTLVVVQGDGPELHMGEQFCENGQITLTYHRHMYRLGEHYNSVQPYVEPDHF